MRRTTGLLLAAALLLPGAARAQPGLTGPYDPFGPGLPPYVNDFLNGQHSPGAPFGPGSCDPRNPGLPRLPGATDPSFPDALNGGGLPWNPLPPGFANPDAPNADFQDPTQRNLIYDQTVLDALNPPQIPPSVALPPHFVEDQMPKRELEVQQESGWIKYLPTIVLPILLGIGALCRRRGGKDDAAR